jgi:heptosyltransferase-2
VRRILVVQTAFLGDVVLTTPLLRELRRAHPDARISILTTPLGAEALEGSPFVDERLAFDKGGSDRGLLGTLRVGRRTKDFDLAIVAHRSVRSGVLARLSGARTRVGFAKAPGAFAYTRSVPWVAASHAVRRYLALAAPAGGDPDADPRPELPVLATAREAAETLLREAGIGASESILAIAPGSAWRTKRWTVGGYADLVRETRSLGLIAILLGSPEEEALCRTIAEHAGAGHVLAGRTPIPVLSALLARSRCLVSNDTGTGHVAAAVGTPVVTIFGPTVPAFGYAPYGRDHRIVEHADLSCRPCHAHGPDACPLGHHRCMTEIDARSVLTVVERGLESLRQPS